MTLRSNFVAVKTLFLVADQVSRHIRAAMSPKISAKISVRKECNQLTFSAIFKSLTILFGS